MTSQIGASLIHLPLLVASSLETSAQGSTLNTQHYLVLQQEGDPNHLGDQAQGPLCPVNSNLQLPACALYLQTGGPKSPGSTTGALGIL